LNTWIFQGNPKLFDFDLYLSHFQVILWTVKQKHLSPKMNIGDSVYIWRSDAGEVGSGGIVAHGLMIDSPKILDDKEAASYYSEPGRASLVDSQSTLRAKILLDSVFLHPAKLTREQLKSDSILSTLSILQIANNTNYDVDLPQARRLDELYFDSEKELENPEDNEASEFPEGRPSFITHKKRERNPALIRAAKTCALKMYGRLFCQACGFDFGKVYGRFGEGFIEAHHTIPVSHLDDNSVSKVEDIVLVCSNCHRILHRRRPWLEIEQLKELLSRQNNK